MEHREPCAQTILVVVHLVISQLEKSIVKDCPKNFKMGHANVRVNTYTPVMYSKVCELFCQATAGLKGHIIKDGELGEAQSLIRQEARKFFQLISH